MVVYSIILYENECKHDSIALFMKPFMPPRLIIADPCAAESGEQIITSARWIQKCGGQVLRAGIWKPRTDPNDWQGSGDKAVRWMWKAKKSTGIAIAAEAKDMRTLTMLLEAGFDYIWIGSRNGQNYALLEEMGRMTKKSKTPVIVKRAMSASLEEWLGSAQYVTKNNPRVILCERGIRGYSPDTRNILDLQTAYLAKIQSPFPVIVDVSHAAGRRDLILPMSFAVMAAGLDGLMIEVHPHPLKAKTDSAQQISFQNFQLLMSQIDARYGR